MFLHQSLKVAIKKAIRELCSIFGECKMVGLIQQLRKNLVKVLMKLELQSTDYEYFKKDLLNMGDLSDLENVVSILCLDVLFEPINNSASAIILNSRKELDSLDGVLAIRFRIKKIESILFKMLYIRTPNLNQIQDIAGFRLIVEDVNSCYVTLKNLFSMGFIPYFRFFDTLNLSPGSYRSLDVNLLKDNQPIQIQIRPADFDESYSKGNLNPENYKRKMIERFRQYLLTDPEFGIDYRINLLKLMHTNFKKGFDSAISLDIIGLRDLLDMYSKKRFDYRGIREVTLNERSMEVLRYAHISL